MWRILFLFFFVGGGETLHTSVGLGSLSWLISSMASPPMSPDRMAHATEPEPTGFDRSCHPIDNVTDGSRKTRSVSLLKSIYIYRRDSWSMTRVPWCSSIYSKNGFVNKRAYGFHFRSSSSSSGCESHTHVVPLGGVDRPSVSRPWKSRRDCLAILGLESLELLVTCFTFFIFLFSFVCFP